MAEPTIICRGLSRAFDEGLALDDLDLEVGAGTVLALLGPNGAGKTTTVRLLNGILDPTTGSSRVLGLDPVTEGHELRHRTGVMTENAGLDDRLTARENMLSSARMRGMDLAVATQRVDDLLERFGMRSHADHRCQGFSTGQRRRVALARALMSDPEVLFLDEPTSGLDPAATEDVVSLIGSLASDRGRTIILCTHFLGEATRVADQMAILNRGRLLVAGAPDQLAKGLWPHDEFDVVLDQPASPEHLAAVAGVGGVVDSTPTEVGLTFTAMDRSVAPRAVAALVSAGADVYALTPRIRTLADVYFAYEERLGTASLGLRAADVGPEGVVGPEGIVGPDGVTAVAERVAT